MARRPVKIETLVLASGAMIWMYCGPVHASTLLVTSLFYSYFSVKYTEYRTPFRIRMNKADMEAGNLATDSLLNYETVKAGFCTFLLDKSREP